MKMAHIHFSNAVAVGTINNDICNDVASVYSPSFERPDGRIVPAKWSGYVIVDYFNQQLKLNSKLPIQLKLVRLTAWNGKNAKPGKGLADLLARCMKAGKVLSCYTTLSFYDRVVREKYTSTILKHSNGAPVTVTQPTFIIDPSSLVLGANNGGVDSVDTTEFINAVRMNKHPNFTVRWGHWRLLPNAKWKGHDRQGKTIHGLTWVNAHKMKRNKTSP